MFSEKGIKAIIANQKPDPQLMEKKDEYGLELLTKKQLNKLVKDGDYEVITEPNKFNRAEIRCTKTGKTKTVSITEGAEYRLTPAEIKAKIARLEVRAKANPEEAEDLRAEISELNAILDGRSQIKAKREKVTEGYIDMLSRLSNTKVGR